MTLHKQFCQRLQIKYIFGNKFVKRILKILQTFTMQLVSIKRNDILPYKHTHDKNKRLNIFS